jgi:hypothetical protein
MGNTKLIKKVQAIPTDFIYVPFGGQSIVSSVIQIIGNFHTEFTKAKPVSWKGNGLLFTDFCS